TVLDGRYYFSLTDTVTTPPARIDYATAPQDVVAQHAVDVWQDIANTLYPQTPGADNKLVTEGQDVTVLAQTGQPEDGRSSHPTLGAFGLSSASSLNLTADVN